MISYLPEVSIAEYRYLVSKLPKPPSNNSLKCLISLFIFQDTTAQAGAGVKGAPSGRAARLAVQQPVAYPSI